MSDNLTAFAQRMNRLADLMARSPRDAVTAQARTYTNSIRKQIKTVAPSGRLSGVGKRGARIGVKYDVQGGELSATGIVQATGPLHILERDTRAHSIPRTAGSRRLRTPSGRLSHKREATGRNYSGKTLLVINGQVVTGPVTHPGTKGKRPFDKGVRAAESAALLASVNSLNTSLRELFPG